MLAIKRDPFSGSEGYVTFPYLKTFKFAVTGISRGSLLELESTVAKLCPRLYSRGVLKFKSTPAETRNADTFRLSSLCRSKDEK
jgi:hypothetical protein